jgi:hypothetical protein
MRPLGANALQPVQKVHITLEHWVDSAAPHKQTIGSLAGACVGFCLEHEQHCIAYTLPANSCHGQDECFEHAAPGCIMLLLLLLLQASPPDVWRQLRDLCMEDRHGASAIYRLEQQQVQQELARLQREYQEQQQKQQQQQCMDSSVEQSMEEK